MMRYMSRSAVRHLGKVAEFTIIVDSIGFPGQMSDSDMRRLNVKHGLYQRARYNPSTARGHLSSGQ